jgi:DNA-directed RNA polymerase subunit RPC12/RpoP
MRRSYTLGCRLSWCPPMASDCPTCKSKEDEPQDYDIIGDDVYICGTCGTKWSQNQKGEKTITDIVF